MLRRLTRDQSGMVLPLAIMMVVLIGVMGAGLLTFVNTDLSTVIEVNRGQKAFDAADSGIQVARRQLLSDADPDHYDSNGAGNSSWAYKSTTGANQQKVLTFDSRTIKVSIQYLPPVTEPTEPTSDQAPEVIPSGQTKLQSGCNYFKVKSYGESGPARRGAEAIYCASKLDVPTSYYTPKDIEFSGAVDVSGVSFFAGRNIYVDNSILSSRINRSAPAIYGDWDTTKYNPPSNHNTEARRDPSLPLQQISGAGLAAEGLICASKAQCSSASDSIANGINDYDSTTGTKGSGRKFCRKPAPVVSAPCSTTATVKDANPSGTISYPFKPDFDPDLELLKEEAKSQNNYHDTAKPIDTTTTGGKAKYPPGSTDQTVFYMNGAGGDVPFNVTSAYAARGTVVIENGNVDMAGTAAFNGIIIITGDGTTTGLYKSTGNPELNGFVLADGLMTIRGDAGAITITDDWTNRPGFYGVKLWSWRECYNSTCS